MNLPMMVTKPRLRPQRRFVLPVFILLVAVIVLAPLALLQWKAIENKFAGYQALVSSPGIGQVLANTAILAAGSVVIALVVGTALALCANLLPRRLRFLQVLPLLPLMTPALAMVAGWSFLLSPHVGYINQWLRVLPWWRGLTDGPIDVYDYFWIVVITGFLLVSFVYVFVNASIANIDGSLLEAGRTSGGGRMRNFVRILLPQLTPALIYSGIIVALLGIGQFTAPLMLGQARGIDVLTTRMYSNMSGYPIDYGLVAAYGSPLIIVGLILLFVQMRTLRSAKKFEAASVRGQRSSQKQSKIAAAVIVLYFLVSVGLPIFALLIVAVSPFYSGKMPSFGEMTLNQFRIVLSDPAVGAAIVHSIYYATVAVVIVLVLGYVLASISFGFISAPRWAARIVDYITAIPLVMPAVLFGVGFLFLYVLVPLNIYGTAAALIIAYSVLVLPHITRIILSGFTTVGVSLFEASIAHGASRWRSHFRIMIPLIRPSIVGGAALGFSILTHDFGISVILRTTDTQVMGTSLYDMWSTGAYPGVAVLSLVMCAVTAGMVSITLALGGRSALATF